MFQMKSVEMVHWDYWQRLTVPLDAQIVTIIGPNGSGKTTLLDALRTLLAIKCSGKRDYKRYVRNNREPFAYLRGVVDNPRRLDGGLYPTPFFPLTAPEVTLVCRIKKQGGDWVRHYAVLEGDAPLEALEASAQWLGVHEYRRRLEAAGLTAAVGEVLALEQGDTDKLTEYSPRQLLDLVFQVFGDKDVLVNYQRAREEQKATEAELTALSAQLEQQSVRVEAMRLRADRHLEWRRLQDSIRVLQDEALPVLSWLDTRSELAERWQGYRVSLSALGKARDEQRGTLALMATLNAAEQSAQAARDSAEARRGAVQQAFMAARDAVKEVEGRLKERDRLQALSDSAYGDDAAALSGKLAALRAEAAQLRDALRDKQQTRRALGERLSALEAGRARAPEDVRAMRAALDEAGIRHAMLSDLVEVTDPAWQGAVEALLRPSRHVVLLGNPADRREAWAIGEKLRYRHFIAPDCEDAPRARAGSLAEVVRLAGPVPSWLSQQLNRVARVEDAREGASVDGDWITRDGYYRERRGARHIGVPAHDYAFGEAARQASQAALSQQLTALNREILDAEARHAELQREAAALAEYLGGMDAIRMLDARAEEFAALDAQLAGLREEAARQGAKLAEAAADKDAAEARFADARLAHDRVCQREHESLARIEQRGAEVALARRQIRRLTADARQWQGKLPAGVCAPECVAALEERFESAAEVRHEIAYLEERLAAGDWETDPTVLELRNKLADDMAQLEGERIRREGELARAATLTDDARGAYINKLKATVRAYGKNVKRLGELAGIGVEVELPQLSNDDTVLAQAGLVLRFDFDHKGMTGMNDGEGSGGQQVMKSLILLIGLMMDEANPSGFVFIDEPFAHLDIFNIDRVAGFLKATEAQYLITTPNTHNINIFAPSDLTLATRKKRPGEIWAPPILQARRRLDA
ncbi:AAA family ATPase [Crenobacter caeni]|uniref:AAA family ATPase n=1 Tax=Crenobacter caeni TaxID=2705474 RepID=A0A6B2KT37_9NEIS|nr:AAA family ATPase [Crenobacter caeni]NDV13412.1 AAA family ATPase [Crenobacter caeni]